MNEEALELDDGVHMIVFAAYVHVCITVRCVSTGFP